LTILEELYPGARTALDFETPFQLLVAVILSARCSDRQVNKITAPLFQKYKTPEDFAALNPGQLAEEIKSCGMYRNKSKNIIAAGKMLVEKYGAQLPASLDELKKLPGVGRKTANVVLNVIYNQPALPVDTHVFRVAGRLGLAGGKTPEQTEKELIALIPSEYRQNLHHQLIAHGRAVCTAQKPKCNLCRLLEFCLAGKKCNRKKVLKVRRMENSL